MTFEDLTNMAAGDDRFEFDDPLQPNKRDQQQYEMAPYNPFAVRPNQTWDDRTIDRMLTIKRPTVPSGTIWITEAGFAETLALLPLNKAEQRQFWRKFRKIQMCASGELNSKIVDSRQDRLMAELVSQKSRLDVALNGNMNEREAWIINKQVIEQTLKTPPPAQPKGFIGSVASVLTGGK